MSQFVVNGQQFESDFEAALYIVLKSDHLTVGSFYDEAVREQQRLSWKLELLKDESIADSSKMRKRVKLEKSSFTEIEELHTDNFTVVADTNEPVSPVSSAPAAVEPPATSGLENALGMSSKMKAPSGQAIITVLQKMKKAAPNNRICPTCKQPGKEYAHDQTILYICNENCHKEPLERIIGWKMLKDGDHV